MDSKLIFSAGLIMLASATLHTIGGQLTLVDPLLDSNLQLQEKVEWLGAWHCITLLLFGMGIILTRNGLKLRENHVHTIKSIFYLCILFSIAFIGASLFLQKHAPQYILFLPMALVIHLGLRRLKN